MLLTLTGAKEENHECVKEASQNSVPLTLSLQSFLGQSAALLKRPIEEPDRFGRMPLLAAAFQLLTGHSDNTVAIFITQSPSLRAVIARPRNRRPSVRSRNHQRHFRHAHSYVLQNVTPRIPRTAFRNRPEQQWSALTLRSTRDQLFDLAGPRFFDLLHDRCPLLDASRLLNARPELYRAVALPSRCLLSLRVESTVPSLPCSFSKYPR